MQGQKYCFIPFAYPWIGFGSRSEWIKPGKGGTR